MKDDQQRGYRLLKGQLLATMIILPFAPFILCLFIGYYHFTVSLKDDTEAKMVRVVEDHRRLIEMFLDERRSDLEFIINSHTLEQLSRQQDLDRILETLRKKSRAFVDLGVFDSRGNHLAYAGPYRLAGRNYAREGWFRETRNRSFHISDIFLGFRRVPHFIIAVVRRTQTGEWLLRATIDTQFFTGLVERIRIGRTGEAYIVNQSGVLQTRRRSGGELMETDGQAALYLKPHQGTRTFVGDDDQGESQLYATAWLQDNHWLLVVRQEEKDAFASLHRATLAVSLISLIGGALIIISAYFMTNRIIARMERADRETDSLNRQLIVAGRLAELGEMSAGFAHEINNPLQIIRVEQTLCRTILEELDPPDGDDPQAQMAELEDSIDQIGIQVDRCGGITQSILRFARQENSEPAKVDLGGFIPQVVGLVSQKAGVEGIELRHSVAEDAPPVQADPGQLQQVLINLLNNAMDAVIQSHGHHGGLIEISAVPVPGEIEITVADNGCGIDRDDLDKLFTPFFTTKPVGRGTGLGLSVCFGIIDRLGGRISVESAKGAGTAFTLHLPLRSGHNNGPGIKVGSDKQGGSE